MQLSEIITKEKYDVFSVTESHLSSEIPDSYIEIDGYTMFRKDQNRFEGEIIIYCRSDLNSKLSLVSPHVTHLNLFLLILITKIHDLLLLLPFKDHHRPT